MLGEMLKWYAFISLSILIGFSSIYMKILKNIIIHHQPYIFELMFIFMALSFSADIGSSDEDWFEVATRQLVNVTIPASQKLDATVIASPHLSQVNHLVSGRQLCPKPSLEQATADDVQLQAPKNVLRNTSTPLSQRQPMGSQTDDSDSYRDFFHKGKTN